jgi:long-chain acyl-CoA synthetase
VSTKLDWPVGLPRTLTYPRLPIGSILIGSERRFGPRVAFHHNGESTTYSELLAEASRFANALIAAGVGRGDVVALHLPNRVEYAVAYYGTILAGATFSPTNPLLPPDALQHQLSDCGAAVVVTTAAGSALIAEVREATAVPQVICVDPSSVEGTTALAAFIAGQPSTPPLVEIDLDHDLAHIAYTGGTTGLSKGVELTHRNVVTNVVQYSCWLHGSLPAEDGHAGLRLDQVGSAEEWPIRLGTSVVINLTPWFHAMGCVGAMSVPLLAGATTVLHDRFDPSSYLAAAEAHQVTSLSGAPTLFAALLDHPDIASRDLSSVRFLSSGAAPLAHHHIERLTARFSSAVISEGYGLTEATMGVTYGPTSLSSLRKVGSVGVPVFDTELEVRDPESGAHTPQGEPGDVWVRGPQVMQRYRERKDETDEVLRDGWLHTGDIGYRDEDGYLFLVDRSKDMLIYKGYNVYPREIEEIILKRSDVQAVAVVGRPDPDVGELVVAFVVANGAVNPDRLLREVNELLPPYKRVREVILTETIPVSAAGKVLKRELRALLK